MITGGGGEDQFGVPDLPGHKFLPCFPIGLRGAEPGVQYVDLPTSLPTVRERSEKNSGFSVIVPSVSRVILIFETCSAGGRRRR